MKRKTIRYLIITIVIILGGILVGVTGYNADTALKLEKELEFNAIQVINTPKQLSNIMINNESSHEVFICGKISSVTTVRYDEIPNEDYILVKETYETKVGNEYKITKENVQTALCAKILDTYINVNKIAFMNPDIDRIENISDTTRKHSRIIRNNSEGILHAQIYNGKIVSGTFYSGYDIDKLKESMDEYSDSPYIIMTMSLFLYCSFVFVILNMIRLIHKTRDNKER